MNRENLRVGYLSLVSAFALFLSGCGPGTFSKTTCVSGASCPLANPCHQGLVFCNTGTPVCQDSGVMAANGTSCEGSGVCITGVCNTLVVYSLSQNLEGWDLINLAQAGDISIANVSISAEGSTDGFVLDLSRKGITNPDPNYGTEPTDTVEVDWNNPSHFSYGRFELSVRFAACASDEELCNGIFTFFNDGSDVNPKNGITDNSEIDIELLCGEPNWLALTVWTDYMDTTSLKAFHKASRIIDMRTGNYIETSPGEEGTYELNGNGILTSIAAAALSDFPTASNFYILGFDWQATYVRFYIKLNGQEVELWRYAASGGIPAHPSTFILNLSHISTHWMRAGDARNPRADSHMQVDWVKIWQ